MLDKEQNKIKKNMQPQCGECDNKKCRDGKDCFSQAQNHRQLYQNSHMVKLHHAASAVEAKYYGKKTRLEEIILFGKELEYQKIGLAFCIGLREEARMIAEILSKHFNVLSVCCKISGIFKKDFNT